MSGVSGGPEPKIGDRVHIEFDGIIYETSGDRRVRVRVEGQESDHFCIPPSSVRVVVPPLKEGDEIFERADLARLTPGTVFMNSDPSSRTAWIVDQYGELRAAHENGAMPPSKVCLPVRVLWVGGDPE